MELYHVSNPLGHLIYFAPPPLSKLTRKEAAIPKKTKPRTFGAEPLEERLPVSSSAAGVLFGLGLANDITTAAYEAPQKSRTESVAQQPTLIDLTLDLQLDALAVDLFHAEESLLDTISTASEDPFVLTPLTPGTALSGTNDDAHRELGDELLLFQISALDFTQVSFEPVTPYWGGVSLDFGDAMTPPEDLTVYGYSPVANELKKKDDGMMQMSCCCWDPPYISKLQVSGCGSDLIATKSSLLGSPVFNHSDKTFYTIATAVNVMMEVNDVTCSSITSVKVLDDSDGYIHVDTVSNYSTTINWIVPSNVSKANLQNVFEFEFKISNTIGTDTMTAFVHFGWAEVHVSFGQLSEVHQSHVQSGDAKTPMNTLIVGQQLFAVPSFDGAFSYVDNSIEWSTPTGGSLVRNYIPGPTTGEIIPLTSSHLKLYPFEGYYYNKSADLGTIIASFDLKDKRGFVHTFVFAGASFYLEAAKVVPHKPDPSLPYTYLSHTWSRTVGVTSSGSPPGYALYVGSLELTTCVEAPIYGDGEIAFTQLVNTAEVRNVLPKDRNSNNVPVLDGSHIYSAQSGTPAKSPIQAENTALVEMNDAPNTILTPGNIGTATKYSRKDDYTFYVIYKPSGASIWVTLASGTWGWEGAVTKTGSVWTLDPGSGKTKGPTFNQPVSSLPTWEANVSSLVWK